MGRSRDLADGTLSELNVDSNTLAVDATNNRVGIGTALPDGRLHVYNASAGTITAHPNGDDLTVENNTESGISILSPDTSAGNIYFGSPSDTDNVRLFGYYNSGTPYMGIMTANSLRVRVDSDGLKFNGDTAAANALNDYETGSFTPDIKNESSSSTWSIKTGKYVKVGNQVTCWGYCDGGNSGSSGSSIRIYNLPFNSAHGFNAGCVGTFIYNGSGSSWGIQMNNNTNTAVPYGASTSNTNSLTYTSFFVTYYAS